jgi:hypothetical protein
VIGKVNEEGIDMEIASATRSGTVTVTVLNATETETVTENVTGIETVIGEMTRIGTERNVTIQSRIVVLAHPRPQAWKVSLIDPNPPGTGLPRTVTMDWGNGEGLVMTMCVFHRIALPSFTNPAI